ncbi:hypothetical protein DL98DRAFT_513673 [Cadophora sp. DSE1049]|nr:hypothetical protein DL98DRAFT_513673 [Cadophora sp. DSE1049]
MNESIPNEHDRIFNPTQYFLGPNRAQALEQPSDIIHHIIHRDRHTGLSRLAFNNLKAKKRADRTLKVDGSSLVIAVDGIIHPPTQSQAKDNVSSKAKASYGIFFGPSSPHNKRSFLPASKASHTREAAILRGCYDALDYLLTTLLPSSSPTLLQTIILTDSLYLVKCLTDYVYVWERNGYRDSKGQYVENSQELADLASMVLHFERVGVQVGFWLVGGAGNKEARQLASEAVEEVGKSEEENARNVEVEILDMKGLDSDMKALELELERGFVSF